MYLAAKLIKRVIKIVKNLSNEKEFLYSFPFLTERNKKR